MNYFCLITSDGKVDAIKICEKRIDEKKWPIYSNTKFKDKFDEGDRIVFYIAGTGEYSQSFIGSASVKKVEKYNSKENLLIDPDKFTEVIYKYLILEDVKKFKNSVEIKKIKNKLNFIKFKDNYGLHFIGGVTKIDEDSFKTLYSKGLE